MINKLVFASLLFFCGVANTNAQSSKNVVYLKNGSAIKGTILEQIPNKTILF